MILAADHRARGVITIEPYELYLEALKAALGVLRRHPGEHTAVARPGCTGAIEPRHRTYLSLNRTGLAASAFELDDRAVASVESAAADGWTGVKHMTRIDLADPVTASALELLGKVLESARAAGLEALVECLSWRDGQVARDTDSIVFAAIVAHDLGAPVLKVPVPDVAPGRGTRGRRGPDRGERRECRCSFSVARAAAGTCRAARDPRAGALDEIRDAMAGGAAGLAVGRVVFQDPDPATMARLVADAVHEGARPGARPGAGAAGVGDAAGTGAVSA